MDLYREQLLDHYHNPRGWGLKSSSQHQIQTTNPLCGDNITVQVEVEEGVVTEMRFESEGCVISRAAASLMADALLGQQFSEVQAWGLAKVEELLGLKLPPNRISCALLSLQAVQQILKSADL